MPTLAILALLAAPPAPTLSLEPLTPTLQIVHGTGYRDKWVTVAAFLDGVPVSHGVWAPVGPKGIVHKPLFLAPGLVYFIEVRSGAHDAPGVGKLISSGVFLAEEP